MNIQEIENAEYEANAAYDYIHEAYAATAERPTGSDEESYYTPEEFAAIERAALERKAAFVGPPEPWAADGDPDYIPF